MRRLAYEAADTGLLSPELAAGIRRVKGARKLGVRLGNWLTADEAKALLDSADVQTVRGKRSRALLALCLGCGLRRSELARLTIEHLQRREDHWAIVNLMGKAAHPNGSRSQLGQIGPGRMDGGGNTRLLEQGEINRRTGKKAQPQLPGALNSTTTRLRTCWIRL